MLYRFVLRSAASGRTAEVRLSGPASLARIQSAAHELLASDPPSGSSLSATALLSYADEHDPHNTLDNDALLNELIKIRLEEKERKAHQKQEQEASAHSAAAAAAEPAVHDLSASTLLVSHPEESKQEDEELAINLLVEPVEPHSPVDQAEHKQDQAMIEPRLEQSPVVPTLPPGGAPAAASPPAAAVSGPAVSSGAGSPPTESKEELESEYALINQQGEIDESHEAKGQDATADEPVSVIAAVKRRMSNPDLPFVMIEQQLAQWTKAAGAWIVERAKQGWQKGKQGLQFARQNLFASVISVAVVLLAINVAMKDVGAPHRAPVAVAYSGALVSNDAGMIDPAAAAMVHKLETLEQAMQEMIIREEMREYQEYRARMQAEEEAEEERKKQISERVKSFVQASRQSVESLAESVSELLAGARDDIQEMCIECTEEFASLMHRLTPLRRSLDEKASAVASSLRWFRDEAASYIRDGINVPFNFRSLFSTILESNNQLVRRLTDPAAMDDDSEEGITRQLQLIDALRRSLKDKGIVLKDMEIHMDTTRDN